MTQHLERRLQIVVADFLRLSAPSSLIWFHVPNGELRTQKTAALLQRMGTRAGVPDFAFVLPDGRAAFIELKIKAPLTKAQSEFKDACDLVGAPWAVCRSLDDVIAYLSDLGVRFSARVVA